MLVGNNLQSQNLMLFSNRFGPTFIAGAQFEGDLGEILALGAEISPYIGLREKWESFSLKKKFSSCQHTIDKL